MCAPSAQFFCFFQFLSLFLFSLSHYMVFGSVCGNSEMQLISAMYFLMVFGNVSVSIEFISAL